MAQIDDLVSQISIRGADARFKESAAEREQVKSQLALGMSPVAIEKDDRIQARAEHLGCGKAMAKAFAEQATGASYEELAPRAAAMDWSTKNIGLERLIGADDLLSAAFLKRGAECSKSVCCISQDGVRVGTGFMVSPRVMMTNAHVIPSLNVASECTAEFNFEDKLIGNGTEASVVFNLKPSELLVISPESELDYALVAVEPESGNSKIQEFGFLRLDALAGKVLRGESLNIIQHPNGKPKQVAIRQNRFTALLENHMHYEADTQPGSSGSPVFNDQWQVVCLHHAGVPLKDGMGRILTKDNRVWNNAEDPALIKWVGNEGVRISRIIADVHRQTGGNEPLLAQFPLPANNPSNESEKLDNRSSGIEPGYSAPVLQSMVPPQPNQPQPNPSQQSQSQQSDTRLSQPSADSQASNQVPISIRITLG